MRGDTSSLFHAILRSAQSSAAAMDTSGNGVVSNHGSEQQKKEPAVEIIAHRGKEIVSLSQNNTTRHQEKSAVTSSLQTLAIDSDEEEEVVQLQTEFSHIQKENEIIGTDPMILPSKNFDADVSDAKSKTNSAGMDTTHIAQKRTNSSTTTTESKSKSVEEEEDITDLSQALKKKKKSKKK